MTTGSVERGEGLARAYSGDWNREQEREEGSYLQLVHDMTTTALMNESLDKDDIFLVTCCLIVLSVFEARE